MNVNNLHRSEDAATTIRAVEPGDRDQWERLYRQYAEFYRVSMDDAIQECTWSWLMAPEHPEEGIVAVLETGEVVGLAHYWPFPKPLLGKDAGFLDDLFVAAAHRGQGVGRSLVAEISSIAHERGWPLVRWITAQDNEVAQQLYDRVSQETAWITYDLTPSGHETARAAR